MTEQEIEDVLAALGTGTAAHGALEPTSTV